MGIYRYIASGIFVIGLGVAFFSYERPSSDGDFSSENEASTIDSGPASRLSPITENTAMPGVKRMAETEGNTAFDMEPPWNSPAGIEEVQAWQESRGYFPLVEIELYKTYGVESLQTLADTGDLKAIHALAELRAQEGDVQVVKDIYLHGAVLGSTSALLRAARIMKPARDMSIYQGKDGEKLYREHMHEALSLLEVALIRGDESEMVTQQIREIKKEISLTDAESSAILRKAAETYAYLEYKRNEAGLGPFNNDIPPVIAEYFSAEARGFIN